MKPGDLDKIIGENLKRLRLAQGMSQARVGSLLEPPINSNAISEMERGVRGMGKDLMSRLCEVFDVRPLEFYREPKREETTPLSAAERDLVSHHRELEALAPEDAAEGLDFYKWRLERRRKSTGSGKGTETSKPRRRKATA